MKRLAIALALLGVAAGLWLGLRHRFPHRASHLSASRGARDFAPALTLVDLAGERIDTASLQGKVVLINFWAAWCTPCAEEVPQLIALQDRYRAAGLQTIGISMEDKESALRDFYRKYKMNYPVVIGNQKIAQEYGGILGLPTTFLIGRDGRIHAKHSGMADFPALEAEIVSLLHAGT